MNETTTAAFVGATGGAGTTRCTVETATLLAGDGHDVAVLDAAFATQGLSEYVGGRLDPDLTALLTDATDRPLDAGLVTLGVETDGRVACCPARAPFERLARAKTADAAREFEGRIAEAAAEFDAVLVDVPPVAANQAVAAVVACDRLALLAPGTPRGADAIQRADARLSDLGEAVDVVAGVRGDAAGADVVVPETDAARDAAPTVTDDPALAAALADLAAATLDVEVTVERGGFLEGAREYVR